MDDPFGVVTDPIYEVIFSVNVEDLKQGEGVSGPVIIEQLRQNKKARKLSLSMIPLKASDLLAVARYFQERAKDESYEPIRSLNLTGVKMDEGLMTVIAEELLDNQKYTDLKWLNLSQTGLTSQKKSKMEAKVTLVMSIKSRISKDANSTEANKSEETQKNLIKILCDGLRKNKSLETLLLNKNRGIGSSDWQDILNSLAKHPKLAILVYNTNTLTKEECEMLGDFLGTAPNPHLRKLSLESCGIGDKQLGCICPGIARNKVLRSLHLQQNEITDEGVEVLCNALRRKPLNLETEKEKTLLNEPSAIYSVNLASNSISEKSGEYLAEVITGSYHLENLDLSFNPTFGDEGVNALCRGLLQNESLISLRLGGCNLTNKCCEWLGKALEKHSNLASLQLQMNYSLTEEGIKLLSQGIAKNSHLSTLNLSGLKSISPEGWKALREGLVAHVEHTQGSVKFLKKFLTKFDCSNSETDSMLLSDDIINYLTQWVGYQCITELCITNCFETQKNLGINEVVSCVRTLLENYKHNLVVLW